MRNVYLFLTADLGCLILAGMTMLSPATMVFDFMNPERSECSRLLKGYSDSREWPQPGTAEICSLHAMLHDHVRAKSTMVVDTGAFFETKSPLRSFHIKLF